MTVATERLPQPYVVDAVVSNDVIARTLTVRLSDAAGGYEQSLWLQAYQQLRAAEQWVAWQQPTVWASAVGASRIAFATPDPDRQALLFHFQPGVAAYAALIGKQPGLTATVAVDRSSGRFMSVRFRHRP
jgi:hypothetical protein